MSVMIPSMDVFIMSGFRDAAYSLPFHEAIGIDLGSMVYFFVSIAVAGGVTGNKDYAKIIYFFILILFLDESCFHCCSCCKKLKR